jgi:hypothetical protein
MREPYVAQGFLELSSEVFLGPQDVPRTAAVVPFPPGFIHGVVHRLIHRPTGRSWRQEPAEICPLPTVSW